MNKKEDIERMRHILSMKANDHHKIDATLKNIIDSRSLDMDISKPFLPCKPLSIQGIDGYETYKIDENTIGVRPIWISVLELDKLPESLEEVLFTNGEDVFKGYRLQSLIDEPDMWYSSGDQTIYEVTHWMSIPKVPKKI